MDREKTRRREEKKKERGIENARKKYGVEKSGQKHSRVAKQHTVKQTDSENLLHKAWKLHSKEILIHRKYITNTHIMYTHHAYIIYMCIKCIAAYSTNA